MQVYEDVLVERMFDPWGARLLDQVGASSGAAVLDVACGPGTVARLAARRVGSGGSVTGCDLNAAMLAIAEAKPAVETGASITYVECPADSLGALDASFDVVVCQQGLQFFPDRVGAVREMRRVTRPGATLGIAVWCEIERCPPFAAIAAALGEVFGEDVAGRYRNGPWGFPDAEALRTEVEAGGFTGVRVERDTIPVVFEGGVEQLLRTLAAAPVGERVAALDHDGRATLVDALARAASAISDGREIRSEMACNTAIVTR